MFSSIQIIGDELDRFHRPVADQMYGALAKVGPSRL